MFNMSRKALLLNGAMILFVFGLAVTMLHGAISRDDLPPCSDRYEKIARISFDRSGEPMSSSDLQARYSAGDAAGLDKARVIRVSGAPNDLALELDLSSASAPDRGKSASQDKRPGIRFLWSPASLGKPTAACLSYALFLPNDFDFGQGGLLPGFFGSGTQADKTSERLATRSTWNAQGTSGMSAQTAEARGGQSIKNTRSDFEWPRGKWLAIEQEIKLNAPNAADGMLRVWVNGALTFDNTAVTFRSDPSVALTGVASEALMTWTPKATKPGAQKILITPYEIRWGSITPAS